MLLGDDRRDAMAKQPLPVRIIVWLAVALWLALGGLLALCFAIFLVGLFVAVL